MKQFHSTVVDQSLPIATIRCMYYNCNDDNDSWCLEYEGISVWFSKAIEMRIMIFPRWQRVKEAAAGRGRVDQLLI